MSFSLKKILPIAAPILGAVGGGIFGGPLGAMIGGGVGSSIGGYLGEQEARGADIASAREQMEFQERMSSTAHQREVMDLKKAGLNPVLSANAGASTPVGQSIDAENMFKGIEPGVATALGAVRLSKELKEADSRIDLLKKQANSALWESKNREAEFFKRNLDNTFIQKNPWFFKFQKILDLLSPTLGSARDAGILYRSFKGFGPETTETFDSKGEHRRTTIRQRR